MKRVLIVDDDPDVLEGLSFLLADHFDLAVARDGAEALEQIDGGFVADAILLDLMMPVIDGAGLIAELGRRGRRFPILLASAHADLAGRAVELGADDYIAKPFGLEVLLVKLNRLLGNHAAAS